MAGGAYHNTGERLLGYYAFPEQVVEAVADVAATQVSMTYDAFMALHGVPEPQVVKLAGSKPIEVVDIIPKGDYEPARARVMHLAMGNSLDKNQLYQIATVFAADPTVRTIAFGNPSSPGHKAGVLSLPQGIRVARGDLRPLVDSRLRYLEDEGIIYSEQEGFSAGSLFALASTTFADRYDQGVTQITTIEPADVKDRGRLKAKAMGSLGLDFVATGKPLADYVRASGIPAFSEARNDSAAGLVLYGAGLLRATNLAISRTLAGDRFTERAADALGSEQEARLDVIWGSESELAIDALMNTAMDDLRALYGSRVAATRIPNQRHNMVNDIHLQAALFRHARSR